MSYICLSKWYATSHKSVGWLPADTILNMSTDIYLLRRYLGDSSFSDTELQDLLNRYLTDVNRVVSILKTYNYKYFKINKEAHDLVLTILEIPSVANMDSVQETLEWQRYTSSRNKLMDLFCIKMESKHYITESSEFTFLSSLTIEQLNTFFIEKNNYEKLIIYP